jgi:hypothetical protein
MIQTIGAMHAALRAKKRAVQPPQKAVVEIKKRRRAAAQPQGAAKEAKS